MDTGNAGPEGGHTPSGSLLHIQKSEVGGGPWGQAGPSNVVPSCLLHRMPGPSPTPRQKQYNCGQMVTCLEFKVKM